MIHVGTSGFVYQHWRGVFYPEDLPAAKWLEYYASHFDCVEINSSFYHLPKPETIVSWRDRTPRSFRFVLKGSRFVSHRKRLKNCEDSVKVFYERAFLLERKLAGVLWQLPPKYKKDLAALEAFLKLLPPQVPVFLELRHRSWFDQETFDFLRKHRVTFCVHDLDGVDCPAVVTAPLLYVRFHGPSGRYRGCYPDSKLRSWAAWIKETGVKRGFVFFNNDVEGHAVRNAQTLRRFLEEAEEKGREKRARVRS